MSSQSDAPEFNVNQLSRLLDLYHDREDAESNAGDMNLAKKHLLRDLLGEVLPLPPDVIERLPALLQRLHRETPRVEGRSLLALLNDPHTSVQDLRAIKEYAKAKTGTAETEARYEAAGAVYYGAIAAALVFHDELISHSSWRQLHESFSSLNAKEWIIPDLQRLFRQAKECCLRMIRSHPDAPA